MDGTLGFLGSGGGGGMYSGGSVTGSLLTLSKEDNVVLSSEVCSSYPDESELELGLGLSLSTAAKPGPVAWGQYARILTAQDFPSFISKAAASSSSSSSTASSVTKVNNSSAGTKRTADSVSPPRHGSSQVVGWPPVRAFRINSLVNQSKSPTIEELNSTSERSESKNGVAETTSNGIDKNHKEEGIKTSLFVKVNMDGVPIGRKIDLSAHNCYETLAETLVDMFFGSTPSVVNATRSNLMENSVRREATSRFELLEGSSEFVLTYEDKEGDWMLVGDVPWGMFTSSVKRLRILRKSEANGLAPRVHQRNGRQRTKPI